MNSVHKSIAVAITLMLAASSVQAQDPAPRDVRDLIGDRASSGESALKQRGYEVYKTQKGSDRVWTNWWNQDEWICLSVVTMNGRFDSIVTAPTQDCGLSGSRPVHGSSHGSSGYFDTDDLVGMRASSGEQELESNGYDYRKTLTVGEAKISYWWNSRMDQCIAVTTKDGRYSSVINQPESMCDGGSSSSGHDDYDRDEGVTLYHDYNFRGGHETVYDDIPDMSRTSIGNDSLSSIEVPRGCEVTLYADNNYRGRSVELWEDESELGRTAVGNDSVSSMRVDCGGGSHGSSRDGVTLYHDYDFRGGSESFRYDVPDLARTSIGNDSLSSIRIPPGCHVTLYADNNYRGHSVELYHDEEELGRTAVGNDSASSMRVDCR